MATLRHAFFACPPSARRGYVRCASSGTLMYASPRSGCRALSKGGAGSPLARVTSRAAAAVGHCVTRSRSSPSLRAESSPTAPIALRPRPSAWAPGPTGSAPPCSFAVGRILGRVSLPRRWHARSRSVALPRRRRLLRLVRGGGRSGAARAPGRRRRRRALRGCAPDRRQHSREACRRSIGRSGLRCSGALPGVRRVSPAGRSATLTSHGRMVAAVEGVLPVAAVHSIDELSARLCPRDDPRVLVAGVKSAVATALTERVPVSVAVAPSAWLAKTAAEAHKPSAAVVWRRSDLPGVYAGLELEDLPGAGPRICKRLRSAGIGSVRALHDTERSRAILAWGSIEGERVRLGLRGEDVPAPARVRRSVAHGRVLGRSGCWRGSRQVVRWLAVCALRRCVEGGQVPRRVAVRGGHPLGRGPLRNCVDRLVRSRAPVAEGGLRPVGCRGRCGTARWAGPRGSRARCSGGCACAPAL